MKIRGKNNELFPWNSREFSDMHRCICAKIKALRNKFIHVCIPEYERKFTSFQTFLETHHWRHTIQRRTENKIKRTRPVTHTQVTSIINNCSTRNKRVPLGGRLECRIVMKMDQFGPHAMDVVVSQRNGSRKKLRAWRCRRNINALWKICRLKTWRVPRPLYSVFIVATLSIWIYEAFDIKKKCVVMCRVLEPSIYRDINNK